MPSIAPPPSMLPIGHLEQPQPITSPDAAGLDLGRAFADAFAGARAQGSAAASAATRFAAGDPAIGIHEVMIASEKASIELRFATTLKNKALEAYRELMNTPV